MRKMTLWALILALTAAPVRAQTFRVTPIESAPAAAAPAAGAAVLVPSPAAPFALAPLVAPVPAAVAAALPPAAALPAASAPAPARAKAFALPPAASAKTGDADDSGRALFDQAAAAPAQPIAELVRAHAGRALREGVFIQQEHEGSLIAPDSRDSSGNVFRYYKPVEMRAGLAAETESGLKGFSRLAYSVRRAVQIRGRGTPEAAWRAWPLAAKLDYLDRLERAITAERGPRAAWDGKVSLIMERGPEAPDFVTKNPHMEAPPASYRGAVGARYLQPEIVSAKDAPAASVDQALGRARMVIAETGHAGVQFHVFVKAAPGVLLAQMDRLDGALQLVNDALFAKAVEGSEQNITHGSLMPWHRGRSGRVRELLEKADAAPHVPAAEDPDSEKHAFVGLRYWGMEGGKAVISFELRGASLPWKRAAKSAARELDSPARPERDYDSARSYLTFLSVYAEALARGEAPRAAAPSVALDEAAADSYLRERAKALGAPDSAFDGLAALGRRLTGAARAPQGYVFPFAASPSDSPELRALADQVVVIAARAKAVEEAGRGDDVRHEKYLLWSAYAEWAARYGSRQDARLADLVRAAAR